MKKPILPLSIFLTMLIALAGCASIARYSNKLLPSSGEETKTHWKTLEELNANFDKIQENKTTRRQIKEWDFDPDKTPNMTVLGQLEIINLVWPHSAIKKEDLGKWFQEVVRPQKKIYAYIINAGKTDKRRQVDSPWGFLKDALTFKRVTITTGWEGIFLIVMAGNNTDSDTIIHKQRLTIIPKIHKIKTTRNPLGPLQELGDILEKGTRKIIP